MTIDHSIAFALLAGLALAGCAPVVASSTPTPTGTTTAAATPTPASTTPAAPAAPSQAPAVASSAPSTAPVTVPAGADAAKVTLLVDGKPFTVDGTLVKAARSQYELGFTFGNPSPGDTDATVAYNQSTTGKTFGLGFTLKGNVPGGVYVFTTAGLFDNAGNMATRVLTGGRMDVTYKGSVGSNQDPKVIHVFDLVIKGMNAQ